MSFLLSVWQIVIKRSISNWRLLSTVLVGIIITVAIISSLPLYANAIDEFGLRYMLDNRYIELLDLNVYAPNYHVDYNEFISSSHMIDELLPASLQKIIQQQETWIKTTDINCYYTDRPTDPRYQPKGFFTIYSNLEHHIKIIEGTPSEPVPSSVSSGEMRTPGFIIEGMIGSETAAIMNVKVGDSLAFPDPYGNDGGGITVLLTAIIDPVDPTEEFWFLNTTAFTYPVTDSAGQPVPPVVPIFIPEDTLFHAIPELLPDVKASYNWYYYIDKHLIKPEKALKIKSDVQQFENTLALNLQRSGLLTILDSVIAEYSGKLLYSQIPIFLIIIQITAIILYYLMMVSNMIIERQSVEISIFRSRGAGAWHIFLIYFTEGLFISAAGAVIGLFFGSFLFGLLGKTGVFHSLTGGEPVPITYSSSVIIMTVSAAVLCLVALLIPALQVARRSIMVQRQSASRPSSKPFWKRFYLDIALLIVGIGLYWEAREQGSFVSTNVFGDTDMDPLLLITPILLIIAVAIVFLRVFPFIIRLFSRLTRYFGSAWLALGLWYMARNPDHYTRPVLLLLVATSVGLFSSTFIGTLDRSYTERNLYLSGGDVRIESLNDTHISKNNLEERYFDIAGVENVGIAYRAKGKYSTPYSAAEIEVLAVDPEKMTEMAWFREDFDDKSLTELMNILMEDNPSDDGIEIPDEAETLGLWVYSESGSKKTEVFASIRDGKARYQKIKLGETSPDFEGWQYMEAKIRVEGSPDFLPSPRNLSCLFIRTNPSEKADTTYQTLYLDNLQVGGTTLPEPLVLEDFEEVDEWMISTSLDSTAEVNLLTLLGTIETDNEIVHNDENSGMFRWKTLSISILGIYHSADTRPLTAIASKSFISAAGLKDNTTAKIKLAEKQVAVTVNESVDYFPSLNPYSKGFLIVSLDRLFDIRNRQLDTMTIYPNEAWLDLTDDTELRDAVIDRIDSGRLGGHQLYDVKAMIAGMKDDPLIGAAWSGMLLIVLFGVILVSGLGFLVYSYITTQQRQLDFAILRTLGFSFRQIIGLVCFEQFFIICTGISLGTILGERLSTIMMPFLELSEQGGAVLPPFVLTTDWGIVGSAYGLLIASFIITISMVIRYFSRVKIHESLRMGDR